MKTDLKKKEIRSTVENAMSDVLMVLNVAAPSKRTRKILTKASKRLSSQISRDLKKQLKAEQKKSKVNGKPSKKAESRATIVEVN